jgi:hypothetical protein
MADMNGQGLRDLWEGLLGFLAALALGGLCIMILLGALGFFDQGIRYKYPSCQPGSINALFTSCDQRAAKERRR